MKLRQKLAVVLASAMVVTAVPVVTMAASTSYASKVVVAAKDSSFESTLVVDVKDETTATTNQVLYLELSGAKFNKDKYEALKDVSSEIAAIKVTGDKSLEVTLNEKVSKGKINIPVFGKELSGDEVTVTIDGDGTRAIDNATVVVAKKSDAKATVKADSAKKIDGEGTVATITIEEPFKNVFAGEDIILTLENGNYKFTSAGKVTVGKGLSGETGFSAKIKSNDNGQIVITVPEDLDNESLGNIKIEGITVKSLDKNPENEDIQITVSGEKVTETTVTVAKVTDYAGELVLSDKAVDITSGQEKSVKVKLKETLADSFVEGKEVEFTIDKGYLTTTPGGVKGTDGFYTDGIYKNENKKKASELIGFTYTVEEGTKALSKEFELKIQTKLEEEGDITLTASGTRAIGNDLELVVATVKPAVEITNVPMVAQTGLKDQKGGEIVITETAKGNVKGGEEIVIVLEDGVTFSSKKVTVDVTEGDVIIDTDNIAYGRTDDGDDDKSTLVIPVKRSSKTASKIVLSDFAIKADRTLADGSYFAKVKGAALTKAGEIKVANFLTVGEAAVGTSSFTIGEASYVLNGKTVAMDVAPYIEDGRTMVPVKYVAAALGLDAKDIVWDQANKTVTVFADRTVQLKANSNVAVVNGAALTIDGKVVIKDGRTFVPVSQIGNLLGVTATWDAATKTATFSK